MCYELTNYDWTTGYDFNGPSPRHLFERSWDIHLIEFAVGMGRNVTYKVRRTSTGIMYRSEAAELSMRSSYVL